LFDSSKSESLNFCSTYGESDEAGLTFEVAVDCTGGYAFTTIIDYPFENISRPKCDTDLEISCEASDGGPCLPFPNQMNALFAPTILTSYLVEGFVLPAQMIKTLVLLYALTVEI